MTETVCWVSTPPCRSCTGHNELLRRPSCIGCEKPLQKKPPRRAAYVPAKPEKNIPAQLTAPRQIDKERVARNRRVAALHEAGMSYGKIARLLGIPRATVQSADAAGRIARAESD